MAATVTANATVREIKAGYKVRSGKLRDHVTQETVAAGQYGVGIRITNTSKLASLYEDGTQARHTAIGANRGAMPPAHVFRPPMIRNRRRMYDDLKAMLVNHGLTVTGDV